MQDVFEAARDWHRLEDGRYFRGRSLLDPLISYAQVYLLAGDGTPHILSIGRKSAMGRLIGRKTGLDVVGRRPSHFQPEIFDVYRDCAQTNRTARDTVRAVASLPGLPITAYEYNRLVLPVRFSDKMQGVLTFVDVTNTMQLIDR